MASANEVDLEELRGRTCFGGLDLAAVSDVTAFVLVFPMDDGELKVVSKVLCFASGRRPAPWSGWCVVRRVRFRW
jgi:phage terminase large subunit-like protein